MSSVQTLLDLTSTISGIHCLECEVKGERNPILVVLPKKLVLIHVSVDKSIGPTIDRHFCRLLLVWKLHLFNCQLQKRLRLLIAFSPKKQGIYLNRGYLGE